ncbi:disease resistance protein RUN1-like [Cornus florida]|uniref:disease resistance protein RUN1-like n=1 Tax=Cornus florida TaxID=4283 RepID=UPI0028988C7C|nr:disease resistance protein RUN1-like [Cornus florida]
MERKRQRTIVSEMESDQAVGPSKRRIVSELEFEARASSSSCRASLQRGEYEVFLSFRGPDTRYTFTDYLYNDLKGVGVRTFRDDDELRVGEEIGPELLKAITESKISIPIFSKTYASSKWCLQELAQMVECRRTKGQVIVPIFYDVAPSVVKLQCGDYKDAFLEHERSFDEHTVNNWKDALREVGSLKGWDVEKEAYGYQGKLVKEIIVPAVLLELKKNYMVVPHNLVGIDHHEKEMMRLLDVDTSDVRIVVIHGMCGIGKTTIAKFIYNKLLKSFECHSFLSDVREMAQKHQGLVSLQKQLLNDTLNWSPNIANVDSGLIMSRNKFLNKKVLIVLDDVNGSSQFHSLAGERGSFGRGSRIIVTTRNKDLLNALEVDGTYEPPIMNHLQSLQLFSMHAFRRESPPKDYDNISRKVASSAAGLPLALEVIGSFLFNKELEIWEGTLKELEETPHDEVEKKLRVSYEALNHRQRQIFLDIACLFVGMDKRTVFYMWRDCEYHPEKEFNVLCLLSLVKVGDANKLRMHDQLRALGRKIVCEEMVLGNRSRFWKHDEALYILEEQKGTEKVEALSLRFELGSQKKPCFTSEKFTKLAYLRYLQVDGAELVGDFERLLSWLRWLKWRGCPSYFKIINFHMKNLVILDLSDSGITEDWGGWNQIKMANKLKVLQLANCSLRETPDFSSYATLEILILRGCKSLFEIKQSICSLKNLKVLDISCAEIRKLPDEIWMLQNLEVMDASQCHYLEGGIPGNMGNLSNLSFLSFYDSKIQSLPKSILGLTRLQTLNIGGCTELELQPGLPSSIRILNVTYVPNLTNLVNLQELQLSECHNVVEIPRDIGRLSNLEKLTLDHTNIRSLPEDVGVLSQLKVLDVRFCDDLQCILGLPSSLVDLSLAFCDSLERLPDLSNSKNLLTLLLKNCEKLAEVQGLGELESLTSLYIFACDMLATSENMHNLSNLKKLEILSINNCSELDKVQGLGGLEMLKYLDLRGCENLHKIEGLEALKSLEILDVLRCTSLETIPHLPNTYVRRSKDQISTANSHLYRYWTDLREKKLNVRLPVFSGYRNEATEEALLKA